MFEMSTEFFVVIAVGQANPQVPNEVTPTAATIVFEGYPVLITLLETRNCPWHAPAPGAPTTGSVVEVTGFTSMAEAGGNAVADPPSAMVKSFVGVDEVPGKAGQEKLELAHRKTPPLVEHVAPPLAK